MAGPGVFVVTSGNLALNCTAGSGTVTVTQGGTVVFSGNQTIAAGSVVRTAGGQVFTLVDALSAATTLNVVTGSSPRVAEHVQWTETAVAWTVSTEVAVATNGINAAGLFTYLLDYNALAVGELVRIRVYKMVVTSGTVRLMGKFDVTGATDIPGTTQLDVYNVPRVIEIGPFSNAITDNNAIKITVTQLNGTARTVVQSILNAWDGTADTTKWNGTAVATPATAGIPEVDVKNINNVATTSVTTISANVGTTQPINFTGTGASALAKSDMVDIAGAAVSATIAQIGVNIVNVGGAVSAGSAGYVGIDWGQIANKTSTVSLSNTTVATVSTVTTVTNQLTAAQIATGVWQDATAGDFTTASSIGKALYIANVAPGGSGGHLISGSNSGTTTLGALTVSGATTLAALSMTTLTASGAVAFQSTFAVTTSTSLAALSCTTFTASGAVAFQSTFAVTTSTNLAALSCSTLTASGAVAFQSTFAVTTSTSLAALSATTVTATGTVSLAAVTTSGTVTLNALTVSNATTLSGAVSLGSTLAVTGTTTLAALTTSGTVTFNAFTVTNATTLSGAVSLGSTLTVTGTTTLAALTASGTVSLAAVTTSGTVTMNAFTVTNATTLHALSMTTLTASGAVAFQSTFAVTTSTSLGALSMTTVTASGAVAFQSTFAVTTSTSLGALSCTTLTASGAVAFQSTFIVTGATTLTGALTATNASNNIVGVKLHSAGLDAVLVESGISAGANLTDDSGSTLTGINARQALALVLSSAAAGVLAGAQTTTITIKPAGLPSGNTRISATVDASFNRSAFVLKVPT